MKVDQKDLKPMKKYLTAQTLCNLEICLLSNAEGLAEQISKFYLKFSRSRSISAQIDFTVFKKYIGSLGGNYEDE